MDAELSMYICLSKKIFKDEENYKIIPIQQEQMESIRLWRNAQIDILRQKEEISPKEQQIYFHEVIHPTFKQQKPKQILFSYFLNQSCIGYGGLVHIDWECQRAEVSFLLDPIRLKDQKNYTRDFNHFLDLICQVAFKDLKFNRLCGETFAFREDQISILENFGFKREGVLREHIFKRHQWCDSILHGLLAKEWGKVTNRLAVLITSVSKKMPLIQAIRNAANKLGHFQKIYGSDSHAFCIGQYGVDEFWQSPTLESLSIDQIISYCHSNHITAIIPTRDGDLEFYAKHLKIFEKNGIKVMVSPLTTILTCLDKKRFADFLISKHFPAIPTFLSLNECQASSYVVKERKGSGSQQLEINLTKENALKYSRKFKEPIFQPYYSGQEWSIDVYCSLEGEVKGCVARQRNYVVRGESQVTTTVRYPSLERLCYDLANELNLYGHAVFQVIEDDQGCFHIIECNPRFGGASTASVAVGLDSFLWFFAECLGVSLHEYPFLRCHQEVRQIRYATDKLLPWEVS